MSEHAIRPVSGNTARAMHLLHVSSMCTVEDADDVGVDGTVSLEYNSLMCVMVDDMSTWVGACDVPVHVL